MPVSLLSSPRPRATGLLPVAPDWLLGVIKIRVLFLEICNSFSEIRRDLCSSYFYCRSNSLEKNVICTKALFLTLLLGTLTTLPGAGARGPGQSPLKAPPLPGLLCWRWPGIPSDQSPQWDLFLGPKGTGKLSDMGESTLLGHVWVLEPTLCPWLGEWSGYWKMTRAEWRGQTGFPTDRSAGCPCSELWCPETTSCWKGRACCGRPHCNTYRLPSAAGPRMLSSSGTGGVSLPWWEASQVTV